jgi:hypothetical protein
VTVTKLINKLIDDYPDIEYSFVTLSIKNCPPEKLAGTLDDMQHAFEKLRKRRTINKSVLGMARSLEFTYNENAKEVHPHYHLIIAWKKGEMSTSLISTAWLEMFPQGVAHYKGQHEKVIEHMAGDGSIEIVGAVLETFKYAVKAKAIDDMPLKDFKYFIQNIAGRRLVSFTGVIGKVARLLNADKLMEEVADEEVMQCRGCHSSNMTQAIAKWSGTGYKWEGKQ